MKMASFAYSRHSGLGNKLFGWARVQIYCKETGARPLRTLWFSPHGGGVTRGGIDYRRALTKVWLFNNFRRNANEVPWWKYYLWHWLSPKQPAMFLSEVLNGGCKEHVWFHGDGTPTTHNFKDLSGYQGFLKRKLETIAVPRAVTFARKYSGLKYVVLNVRSGNDFVSRDSGKSGFVKTGLDWYIKALSQIRTKYGKLHAVIISDGGSRQLAPLLSLPDIELCQSPYAVSDLLICANASVLLCCGNSSFCAWASFLGEMDTYTSPTEPIEKWFKGVRGRHGEQFIGII